MPGPSGIQIHRKGLLLALSHPDFFLSRKRFSHELSPIPLTVRNIAGWAGFHLTLAIPCTK